jgi:DNA repair protein RAD50
MGMLIVARAIQGVGGGGTIVLPNICISDLFSMRNRGMYFGILGMVWALASALGPILGGLFTSKASWRWCFYINLPVSGVGMIILFFVLKLHNPRTPMWVGLKAIDWTGGVLIIGGTLMLLLGLEFGGVSYPWTSPTVLCLIIFGVVTIGLFVFNEAKIARYPVTPVRLFKTSNSVASYVFGFFHAFTFMSGSYWLPLYFQGVLRASSLLSGVYLLPFIVSLSLVSAATGVIIKKTGKYKTLIIGGMAITTLGFGLFIDLRAKANWAKLIAFQIVAGIGIGPNFQAPLIALQTNVEPSDIGSATSSFAFLRQLGTSVSVVVGGVIFNNEMQKQQGHLASVLQEPGLADRLSGSNAAGNVHLVASLDGPDGEIARQAYWNALQTMYIVYTVFSGVGLCVAFGIKQVNLSKEHKEHKPGLTTLKGRDDTPETK